MVIRPEQVVHLPDQDSANSLQIVWGGQAEMVTLPMSDILDANGHVLSPHKFAVQA